MRLSPSRFLGPTLSFALVLGTFQSVLGLGITPALAGSTADLTWTVPAGVEVVQLTMVGGEGGNADTASGGAGGQVITSLLVNEGDAFRIGLGADGASAAAGGLGGSSGLFTGFGGDGGTGGQKGGGGGGASVTDIDPVGPTFGYLTVAIASGGGGAGGGTVGGAGGSAGNFSSSGADGSNGSWGGFTMFGGTGATDSTPGAASGAADGATNGTLSNGGDGGSASMASGGGGGAGRYGGGGGASDAGFNPGTPPDQGGGGGGAGSSWVTSSALFVDSTIADSQFYNSRTQTSSIEWIAFDTTSLPIGTAGSIYTADIDATFGSSTQATNFSVSPALPTGLSLNASTGAISGTPSDASSGSYVVTAETINMLSKVVARSVATLTLTINAAPAPSPDGGSTSAITANAGEAAPILTIHGKDSIKLTVGQQLKSSPIAITNGGTYANYSISPALPPGLTLTNFGEIVGTPTEISPYTKYTIRATNPSGSSEVSMWLSVVPAQESMNAVKSKMIIVGFLNRSLTIKGAGLEQAMALVRTNAVVIRARGYADTSMRATKAKKLSTQRLSQVLANLKVSVSDSRSLGIKKRSECLAYGNNCVVLVIRAID